MPYSQGWRSVGVQASCMNFSKFFMHKVILCTKYHKAIPFAKNNHSVSLDKEGYSKPRGIVNSGAKPRGDCLYTYA
jgi:ribosomal protein L15E